MGWDQEFRTFFSDYIRPESKFNSERTDDTVKYCEECKQTYEHSYINSTTSYRTFYYGGHIPSIGKDRKNCPRCASKKASELVKYQGV